LTGSDFIIHSGDIGDLSILPALQKIAPVTAIRGNVDTADWFGRLPAVEVFETGEISIYILHNLADLDLKPEAAGFAAVIYGHSPKPKQEIRDGVLYFNPGSAGPRRFRLPISVGKLTVHDRAISAEIVKLRISGFLTELPKSLF
jgi:putative phosphoesterase